MDESGLYAAAISRAISVAINLSIIWFIGYVILGALVKVALIRFINRELESRSKRFWPVFLSHFIFSILFVNLYALMMLDRHVDCFGWLFLLIYFIILPTLLDILFLRIIPRMRLFQWLLWTPPLKQVIIINVVICLISCIAAVGIAQVL